MKQIQDSGNVDQWKTLYKIAGFAVIVMLIIIPAQIAVFITTPIPASIESWFSLFNSNWLLGLIHQDMLYIINNIIVSVMYLAFYIALRPNNKSIMTIAILLGLLGISAYFASNKSFELLNISNQYYVATSEVQKSMFLSDVEKHRVQQKDGDYRAYFRGAHDGSVNSRDNRDYLFLILSDPLVCFLDYCCQEILADGKVATFIIRLKPV